MADDADGKKIISFNIPQQRADLALTQFAEQADLTLVFPFDDVRERTANRLVGEYRIEDAVKILLSGTGLTPTLKNQLVLNIATDNNSEPKGEDMNVKKKAGIAAFLAGLFSVSAGAQEPADSDEAEQVLEEIIVVGSHIRGAVPVGSPVFVFDRADIEKSGVANAEQMLRIIPQAFAGDASNELLQTKTDGTNTTHGTGVNLRGLGSGSTLTLLNGRRMTQTGGLAGSYVDISSIPMTAIERVEVLTDGASAIYGSDAIAGVVNFVLRKDYEGAETRVRFGTVSEGSSDEVQFGQTFGKNWDSGNALIAYEYYDRENLPYGDKPNTASTDKTSFGGDDFSRTFSNPGTITSPELAGIPTGQDGTNLQLSDLIIGQANFFNENIGFDIVGQEERHSIFLTARQEASEKVEFFAEARYTTRDFATRLGGEEITLTVPDTHPNFVTPTAGATTVSIRKNLIGEYGTRVSNGDVESYGGTLGGVVDFGSDWKLEIYSNYSEEKSYRLDATTDSGRVSEALGAVNNDPNFDPAVDGYFNPFADGSNTPQNVLDYMLAGGNATTISGDLLSVNAKVDGTLFDLPGGAVTAAFGGDFRNETLMRETVQFSAGVPIPAAVNAADQDRDVTSVFAEVIFPLVGEANNRPGIEELTFSAAIRYEDYSDFGSSSDPKFGAVWSPVKGLAFRSSWGTSFKAPKLTDLVPTAQVFFVLNRQDTTPLDGPTPALILRGTNESLTPETSTARTLGMDITPAQGLDIAITYFDIDFEQRIGRIPGTFFALQNLDFFSPILDLNPDAAVLQAFLDSPFFLGNFGSGPPEVIIDDRIRNLATTDVSGLDATLRYDFETGSGDWSFFLNGSYLFNFENAITVKVPSVDQVSTVGQPVDLRLRGNASWNRGGYGASLFVNYVDGYNDTNFDPVRTVSSWTTADFNLRYDTGETGKGGWLADTVVSLNIQNLFDSDPPFVNSSVGYDGANATARGRFVSLSMTKKW